MNFDVLKSINVVLIADRISSHKEAKLSSKTFEKAEDTYYYAILDALKSLCKCVYVYNTPKSFLKSISKHTQDIVISIWSGVNSRNRKSFIPAICEAYGIHYIGCDTFVQTLAQNKVLAKEYCRRMGLRTPDYVVIENLKDIERLENIQYPIVIKPVSEGGSIGISQDCLIYDFCNAERMAKKLLKSFPEIIAEQYVDGYEVCIVLFGNSKEIKIKGATLLEINNQIFLKDFIWGFETKKLFENSKQLNASFLIKDGDWHIFEKIFFSLKNVDIIRIDGRVNQDGFNFLELSPDVHLGPDCSVAEVFGYFGISYKEMLGNLLINRL